MNGIIILGKKIGIINGEVIRIGEYYWEEVKRNVVPEKTQLSLSKEPITIKVEPRTQYSGYIFIWDPRQLEYVTINSIVLPKKRGNELDAIPFVRNMGIVDNGEYSVLVNVGYGCSKVFGVLAEGVVRDLPCIYISEIGIDVSEKCLRTSIPENILIAIPIATTPNVAMFNVYSFREKEREYAYKKFEELINTLKTRELFPQDVELDHDRLELYQTTILEPSETKVDIKTEEKRYDYCVEDDYE